MKIKGIMKKKILQSKMKQMTKKIELNMFIRLFTNNHNAVRPVILNIINNKNTRLLYRITNKLYLFLPVLELILNHYLRIIRI